MKSASSKTPNMRYGVSFLNTNYNDKAVADEVVMDKKSGELGYKRKIDDSFIYFDRENINIDEHMRSIKTLLKNDLNIQIPSFLTNTKDYFITASIDLRSKNVNYFNTAYEYIPIISSSTLIYDWNINGYNGTIHNGAGEMTNKGIQLVQCGYDENTKYVEYELYSPNEGPMDIVLYFDSSIPIPQTDIAFEINDDQWYTSPYSQSDPYGEHVLNATGLHYGKNTLRIRLYSISPALVKSVGFRFDDSNIQSIISNPQHDGIYYPSDSIIYGDHVSINVDDSITCLYNKAYYDDDEYVLYKIYSPFDTDVRFVTVSGATPTGDDTYYLSINVNDEKFTDDSLNWRKIKLNTGDRAETYADIRLHKGINFIKISASANKDSSKFTNPNDNINITWYYFKFYFKFPVSVTVPVKIPRVDNLQYFFAKLNVNPRFLPHMSFIQSYNYNIASLYSFIKLKFSVITDMNETVDVYGSGEMNELNSFIINNTQNFNYYDKISIGFDVRRIIDLFIASNISSESFTKFIELLGLFLNDSFENVFSNIELSTFINLDKDNDRFIKNKDITPLILMSGYKFNEEMNKVGKLADQSGVRSSVLYPTEFEWDDTALWMEKIRDISKDVKYTYDADDMYCIKNKLYLYIDENGNEYYYTDAVAHKSFYQLSTYIISGSGHTSYTLISDQNVIDDINYKIDHNMIEEIDNRIITFKNSNSNDDRDYYANFRASFTAYFTDGYRSPVDIDSESGITTIWNNINNGIYKPVNFTNIKETVSGTSFEELEDYLAESINVTGSMVMYEDPDEFYAEEEVGE